MFVQLHDFQSGAFTPAAGDNADDGTFAGDEKCLKRHHPPRVRGQKAGAAPCVASRTIWQLRARKEWRQGAAQMKLVSAAACPHLYARSGPPSQWGGGPDFCR